MANNETGFFYWYKRYKVRAQDMTDFQEAMVETARGFSEGSMGAAVLRGFEVIPNGGLSVAISPGISTAATGFLGVINDAVTLDVTNASASGLACRSLIVITPNLVDSDTINSPNTPFAQVPLKQLQEATVKLIVGIPSATPNYPAKGVNDVIICGLNMQPSANAVSQSSLDFEVREQIGVNSLIAQNQARWDNRLRPFRSAPGILGIKPSQNPLNSEAIGFTFPGRLTPSLFPMNAGLYNPADTFVNFMTGVISGGDTTTPSFTPIVPSGNKSVICVVSLTFKDELNFNYGDATGSYDQCLSSIQNQIFTGSGSLPALDGNFGLAYVIVTSVSGSVSDIQVIDARPYFGSNAAAAKFKKEVPSGLVNGSNNIFTLSNSPSDPESLDFYVDSNLLEDADYTLNGPLVTITNPDFIPAKGQSVYAKYLIYGAISNNNSSGIQAAKFKQEVPIGSVDGVNAIFTLTSAPVDNDSLDFWVDVNHLEKTDYTIVGTTVTITNPEFIPQLGQSVYTKYLYLGFLSGGGGGGAASGYSPFGSASAPIVVNPMVGIPATSDPLQSWFVKSGGGQVPVTANPQIVAGSTVGQVLKMKVVDGSNIPVFQDGFGLQLNGIWPATGQTPDQTIGSSIELSWDGIQWSEDTRR